MTAEVFKVVHRLRRRLRFVVPAFQGRRDRLERLALALACEPGVVDISLAVPIGSLAVSFDPSRLAPVILEERLADALKLAATPQNIRISEGAKQEVHFAVGGLQCPACARYLERVLQNQPGIVSARVDDFTAIARIVTTLTREVVGELVSDLGYEARRLETTDHHRLLQELHRTQLRPQADRLREAAVLALPVLGLGWLSPTPLRRGLQFALTTALLWRQGRDTLRRARMQYLQGRVGSEALMTLGSGAAYLYSLPALMGGGAVYFDASSTILGFAQLGRYLQARARHRMTRELLQLVDLRPCRATVIREDSEVTIEWCDIRAGDRLRIRPGEKIPVDGTVVEGLSAVDEAKVTGHPLPTIKEPGQRVLAGSVNATGLLTVEAAENGHDTRLKQFFQMVAGAERPTRTDTDERLSARLVPLVSGLAGLTFAGWWLAGAGAGRALQHALAVLLIACPCPLGVATPAVTVSATTRAARRGIYLRDPGVFEIAAQVDRVVLDKTGVLTHGRGQISELINLSSLEDEQLRQLAAAAIRDSGDVWGAAFRTSGQGGETLPVTRFQAIPGYGVSAQIGEREILLGNEAWLARREIDTAPLQTSALRVARQGRSPVFMALDGQAVGLFVVDDTLRDEAEELVEALQRPGMKVMVVSGDAEVVCRQVAESLGLKWVVAPADPARKLALVQNLQQHNHVVAMVGDGLNDAPALAAADLGMALTRGSDMAIESASLTLENPVQAAEMLSLGNRVLREIRINVFWTFIFNVAAVPVAMAGRLSPAVATLAMSLSSAAVAVNFLRWQQDE